MSSLIFVFLAASAERVIDLLSVPGAPAVLLLCVADSFDDSFPGVAPFPKNLLARALPTKATQRFGEGDMRNSPCPAI